MEDALPREREDATIRVWDARTGEEQLALKGHTEAVISVDFSADGEVIVSRSRGCGDGQRIWNASTGQPLEGFDLVTVP